MTGKKSLVKKKSRFYQYVMTCSVVNFTTFFDEYIFINVHYYMYTLHLIVVLYSYTNAGSITLATLTYKTADKTLIILYKVLILSESLGQYISAVELNLSVAFFSAGCINIIFLLLL